MRRNRHRRGAALLTALVWGLMHSAAAAGAPPAPARAMIAQALRPTPVTP